MPASATGSATSRSRGSSQPVGVTSITIKNFDYTVSGTAAAGSMVQVTNNDSETHTVTADTGNAFDVTIQPGKPASFAAPTEGGSYKFHCNFHSNMHVTLTVAK